MENTLRIALIGYGKMGKEIESIVKERGHQVGAIVEAGQALDTEAVRSCDVAIEFTQPDAAVSSIRQSVEIGLPIVVGTTGWYDAYDEIKEYVLLKKGGLLTATNFSIGVQLFFHFNHYMAKVMRPYAKAYNVVMEEIHHTHKKDAPSGTAITTAEHILSQFPDKKSWVVVAPGEAKEIASDELAIHAFREDEVPGVHKVMWQSSVDELQIIHSAHNRKGFATGAVIAAEWLAGKKGVFTMQDVLGFTT
jgi:4-hydroxy-tetrahydrodipicolinate reductase